MTDTDAAAKWLVGQGGIAEGGDGWVSINRKRLASLLAAYAAEVEAGKWVAINSEADLPTEFGRYIFQQRRKGRDLEPQLFHPDDVDPAYWREMYIAWRPMPDPYVPQEAK